MTVTQQKTRKKQYSVWKGEGGGGEDLINTLLYHETDRETTVWEFNNCHINFTDRALTY